MSERPSNTPEDKKAQKILTQYIHFFIQSSNIYNSPELKEYYQKGFEKLDISNITLENIQDFIEYYINLAIEHPSIDYSKEIEILNRLLEENRSS
jgi:hypothetical protein